MYFHAIKKTKTYIVETRKYSYTLPLSPNLKQMATESCRSGQVPSKLELECQGAAQPARLSNEVLLPMAPLVMGTFLLARRGFKVTDMIQARRYFVSHLR